MPAKKILVGNTIEIKKQRTAKFSFKVNGFGVEGFVFFYKGKWRAYLNRCRHVTLPLDFGDNDFFSADRKFLVCKNHGAMYRPEDGECVAGPCAGLSLEPLPVILKDGKIYCEVPDALNF